MVIDWRLNGNTVDDAYDIPDKNDCLIVSREVKYLANSIVNQGFGR